MKYLIRFMVFIDCCCCARFPFRDRSCNFWCVVIVFQVIQAIFSCPFFVADCDCYLYVCSANLWASSSCSSRFKLRLSFSLLAVFLLLLVELSPYSVVLVELLDFLLEVTPGSSDVFPEASPSFFYFLFTYLIGWRMNCGQNDYHHILLE